MGNKKVKAGKGTEHLQAQKNERDVTWLIHCT